MKYAAGLILAALLLVWVLWDTDLGQLWQTLGEASWLGLLAYTFLNLGHNLFRTWRWGALLGPTREGVRFRPMFAAIILGYMTSWIIPGRLGELVRPMLLSAREKVPLGPCIGSVVADRLLDGASLVSLFALGAWLVPLEGRAAEHASLIRGSAVATVVVVVVALSGMLVVSSFKRSLVPWLGRRGGVVQWVGRLALSMSQGVDALRSPRALVVIAANSLGAWLTIATATWIGVRAAGADVPYGAALIILPMLALGVAVPTPGGAGSFHGAMKFGLMLFGVSELVGVSAALLLHFLMVVPVIVLGVLLLWIEGISWKEMVEAARSLRNVGQETDEPAAGRAMEGVS